MAAFSATVLTVLLQIVQFAKNDKFLTFKIIDNNY